jgi:hypothetical protein
VDDPGLTQTRTRTRRAAENRSQGHCQHRSRCGPGSRTGPRVTGTVASSVFVRRVERISDPRPNGLRDFISRIYKTILLQVARPGQDIKLPNSAGRRRKWQVETFSLSIYQTIYYRPERNTVTHTIKLSGRYAWISDSICDSRCYATQQNVCDLDPWTRR